MLALIYLGFGMYVFWNMAFGSCSAGCFFGKDFAVLLYTLPLSLLLDGSMPLHFLTDHDYTMYVTYSTLLFVNAGVLYLIGWLISAIIRKIRRYFTHKPTV